MAKPTQENSLAPVLLCPIIYFLFTPLVISVWFLNEWIRLLVRLLLWYSYGHKIKLVEDGCDGIWNYKTTGNTRTCLLVGTTKRGAIDPDEFADYFEKNVLLHQETRNSVLGGVKYRPYEKLENIMVTCFGYTCWKHDDKFSIKNHVRRINGRSLVTEDDLMEILSELAVDMDERRPQWEFVFIENYQDRNGREMSVMIVRFHHAYMDGLSLLTMFHRYLTPNVTLPLDPLKVKIEPWKLLLYYLNTIIYAPYKFITMMRNRHTNYWNRLSKSPLSGSKCYATAPPIDMQLIKKIRVDTSASVPNLVTLSFIAAAKRVVPADRIPLEFLRFGEMVARVPYPNGDPQNRFAPFSYDVSVEDIGESPEQFVEAVGALRRDRLLAMLGPEPLLFTFVAKLLGRMPTAVLPLVLDGIHNSAFYSNVPAFKEKMVFRGAVLEDFSAWPPMPNQTGIVLASVSCGGILKITGVADSAWLTSEELQRIFIEIPKIIRSIADAGYIPSHYFPKRFVSPLGDSALEQQMYSLDESSGDEGNYELNNAAVAGSVSEGSESDSNQENVAGLRFREVTDVDSNNVTVLKEEEERNDLSNPISTKSD